MLKVKTFVAGAMRVNTYLAYNEGYSEAVIVDPARGKDKIASYAASLGLRVTAVLVTHGHFDHILQVRDWQEDGATVYVHQADADRLNGGNNLGGEFGIYVPPCKADILIKDGDVFDVAGIRFRVIHTPGHSPGSCCYITGDIIFSGDTLFAGATGRTDFDGGNPEEMQKSLTKLFALEGDYAVYPGHEGATRLSNEM